MKKIKDFLLGIFIRICLLIAVLAILAYPLIRLGLYQNSFNALKKKIKMIKELIEKYGKQKINTLTKYPSILTLHKFGEKGKLTSDFTTNIQGEQMFASEKIDGTNVRIICYGNEYLIGSREFILHHNQDMYFDPAQGIVEGIKNLQVKIPSYRKYLTVIYGEFFGGKTSSNSKQYGTDKVGFRCFDIAVFKDLSVLDKSLEEISMWRERETDKGIVYGQNFFKFKDLNTLCNMIEIEAVPLVDFELGDMSHRTILENLKKFIPSTNVALSELAQKKPEGIILRNADRSKIVKIRYEDYERTLR